MTEPLPGQVRLDIFADPVCPWCLIGKAELDRALESRPDHPFAITWQPFRLDPQMPRAGMDYVAYMKMKFTDEKGIIAAMKPVMEASERLGLWINPSLIERVPNTLDAHRLLHWAALEGVQTPVMAALMRAHWREGRNISNPDVLAAIGEGAGMEGAMIHRLLASDADADTVQTREFHARQRGVNSVPTFIVADAHVVTGAQPADLWLRVIDELAGTQHQ
ncbi:DsbA family oxidoreductase [Paracoccus sp. P2]|uniref:DsbA family dithiol-disulfide isomerase n=1 Tax=Paracoccus pantotrophus TaxID=82367 RepID=A0A1I5MT66_PARPN|nr:DsbA family oxidoreductase [Paracoccus pantotrophus]MDF3856358.1 DsbA family oxidoreductase [Paracoccus pantotrophus]QFG37695.1 DsbA family oxidoreductase [Paracoccus pantotrophus]QLH15260.1 DsbA family oxidoreductase [Paracoccus pantotrophus]RDD99810.1 DsbA family oxidoreductase [Paracoccus pantotrophus]RKS51845.1 putative DsbA family dithiol-disulfide isomerase [Paracoccus pantotrophus]